MRYFEIQIPVKTNDGMPFTANYHSQFEKCLLTSSGGYSKLPEIDGVWIDVTDGEMYAEKMIPYRFTMLNPNDKLVNQMVTEIVEFAKKHYDQIAIFIAEIGTAQII